MEWFIDDPHRGQVALTLSVLVAITAGIWLGRKRLQVAVPVAFLVLLLAAAIIPSAIPARLAAQREACVSNLRAIQAAKTQWAVTNHKQPGDIPTEAQLRGTNRTGIFACPRGGLYTIGSVGQDPTCTFSNHGHRVR